MSGWRVLDRLGRCTTFTSTGTLSEVEARYPGLVIQEVIPMSAEKLTDGKSFFLSAIDDIPLHVVGHPKYLIAEVTNGGSLAFDTDHMLLPVRRLDTSFTLRIRCDHTVYVRKI